jgi:nucleotide-binding universal stress UspA family protein
VAIRHHDHPRGHQGRYRALTGAAGTLADVASLIRAASRRHPAPALAGPGMAPAAVAGPSAGPVAPGAVPGAGSPAAARPISLVVGFDDSQAARRALAWAADLLRTRVATLHVIYADRVLADSDLSEFARAGIEQARAEKAARVAAAAAEIAAAAGVPYTFERRRGSPADAILIEASIQDAAEPARSPVVVTGRSHPGAHEVIGSVPVQLLHQSPYPVLTIS